MLGGLSVVDSSIFNVILEIFMIFLCDFEQYSIIEKFNFMLKILDVSPFFSSLIIFPIFLRFINTESRKIKFV